MTIPRDPLNIACIGCLINFTLFVLFEILGYNPLGLVSWIGSGLIVGVIAMSIIRYRDGALDGIISFRQAMSIGMLASIVYSSMFAILIYMYGTFASPSIVGVHIQWLKDSMSVIFDSFGDEMANEIMEELKFITMGSISFGDFQSKLISGAIISLISSNILKRSEDDYEYE